MSCTLRSGLHAVALLVIYPPPAFLHDGTSRAAYASPAFSRPPVWGYHGGRLDDEGIRLLIGPWNMVTAFGRIGQAQR